jgi:glycosyltransferase involved in cell wall biosynthesis
MTRVVICGPIAADGQAASGGFQMANRRMAKALTELGYAVSELAYPDGGGTWLGKLFGYTYRYLVALTGLMIIPHANTFFHITPLARHFLIAELLLAWIAGVRKMHVVVDLRAGSQIAHYRERTGVYRFLYRALIRLSDVVPIEGEPYRNFIASIVPGKPVFHLPNFVLACDLPVRALSRPMEGPRLVYTGFVSEPKGTLHAAKVLREIQRTYPAASLTLIGRVDEHCRKQIDAMSGHNVVFTGPLPQDAIRDLLDRSHYFIFLSLWMGEGHSNALTEAMARGCVPVITRHGFNEYVAGGLGICVEDRGCAGRVADQIISHWKSGEWAADSDRAIQRVRENFTDVAVADVLRRIHDPCRGQTAADVASAAPPARG